MLVKNQKKVKPILIATAIFCAALFLLLKNSNILGNNSKTSNQPNISLPSQDTDASNNKTNFIPIQNSLAIGALGRIEPKSRVLNISHDLGPEGARVGSLLVTEGQEVKQGDILAYFSNYTKKQAELGAAGANIDVLSAKLNSAKSELVMAKREYERYQTLLKKKVITVAKKDETLLRYQQAQSSIESIKAEIVAAEANYKLKQEELKQTILYAPIDGTILKILTYPGERVSDKGVIEMANLSEMDVVAEVYERDINKIQTEQKAEISVPGFNEIIPGIVRDIGFQIRKDDINNTDPLADKDSRIVEVRITVPNDFAARLKHNLSMQVNVKILLQQ